MNDLATRRQQAQAKWDSLSASKVPVIHIGTATCGTAAGAWTFSNQYEQTLEEQSTRSHGGAGRLHRPLLPGTADGHHHAG